MALTLWKNKQSPLTIEEMDGNFTFLYEELENLKKDRAVVPERILSVTWEGETLKFITSHDGVLATVGTPPMWRPRGLWKPQTAYDMYDVVYDHGGMYLCTTPHTSQSILEETFWSTTYKAHPKVDSPQLPPQQPLKEGDFSQAHQLQEEDPDDLDSQDSWAQDQEEHKLQGMV